MKITLKEVMFLQKFKNTTVDEGRAYINGKVFFLDCPENTMLDKILAEHIKRGCLKITTQNIDENCRITVNHKDHKFSYLSLNSSFNTKFEI